MVAIEPATGKVRVMASVPGYDANQVPAGFNRLNRDLNKPLFNRSTQELYPPGSTFKVVTATAALDSGKFTPDSIINGKSPLVVSGAPLANDGGESFGPDHAHRRPHELGEHGLGAGGRAHRAQDAPRVHGPLRLQPGPQARLPGATR